MFAARFLSFAALVAVANAYTCPSDGSGCYQCTARVGDVVTISSTCKAGDDDPSISWMCCKETDTGPCSVAGTCSDYRNKCENIVSINFNVPTGAGILYFQSHDGQASGGQASDQDDTCRVEETFGGADSIVESFAVDGVSKICDFTIDLSTCPSTGGGGGDPHIKTWAGEWFDYSGECDMVLLHAPGFAQGLGLDVHIRTKARYDYSFISNAVLKIDDETFEVASYGDSILNGVSGVDFPAVVGGFPISYKYINAEEHAFSVELGHEQVVRFRVFKDMVTVKFEGALESDFGGAAGLMGSYDARTVTTHNGTVMALDNVDEIAAEWQVKTDSIFASVRAPQFPDACSVPSAQKTNLRLAASAN